MKILVAIDPSQHAREAIHFVKSVKWPIKSKIFLLHVIEMKNAPPLMPSDGPFSWNKKISQTREKMMIAAKRFLDDMKKDIFEQRPLTIKSLVMEGLPGAEILRAVKDNQVDLVILGTRGLSNVKRFLFGSTSDWVMREVPCSVLLVREKLSKVTMGKTAAKILLATDGSASALGTVHMLGLLTCKIPPKVTVTHVVGGPAYLEDDRYWRKGKTEFRPLAEQLTKKLKKDRANHLEEISERVKELNMKVDTVLTQGDPAEEIIKTAERLKAKLLLVGSKGFIESQPAPSEETVRKIIRYAPCSVLLLRPGRLKKDA